MSKRVDISICVCTYQRPELLGNLLSGIQEQDEGDIRLEIVVTDNDPGQSSAPALDYWGTHSRFPMIALHVPEPNIALARNACVQAARGDWIAFIDDDEWPEPRWVANLLSACRLFNADIAFGPVIPALSESAPAWVVEGRFFERPRHSTGTLASLRDARTSNALVRRDLVRIDLPFDPDFGRTGGEDHILFRKLEARGARMVWADDAVVHESVPAERTTLKWLLLRSLRTGQVATRGQLLGIEYQERLPRCLAIGVRAAGNFVTWTAIAVFRAPFSKSRSVRAAVDAASYLGRLLALFGHRYQEYRH